MMVGGIMLKFSLFVIFLATWVSESHSAPWKSDCERKSSCAFEQRVTDKNTLKRPLRRDSRKTSIIGNGIKQRAAGGTIFIGNGGEGIEDAGRLYLRDLYEVGIHQSPYFGAEVDADISRILDPVELKRLADDPLVKSGFVSLDRRLAW